MEKSFPITFALDAMRLKGTSILIVRYPEGMEFDARSFLNDSLDSVIIPEGVAEADYLGILCAPIGIELEALSEKEMNDAGWFRKQPA